MRITIENGTLFVNDRYMCAARTSLGGGLYDIALRSMGGDVEPVIAGVGIGFHGDGDCDDGVLVGEFICDGVAIGARSQIARLVQKIAQEIEDRKKVTMEIV